MDKNAEMADLGHAYKNGNGFPKLSVSIVIPLDAEKHPNGNVPRSSGSAERCAAEDTQVLPSQEIQTLNNHVLEDDY